MILDKLKAYGWMVAAILVSTLLALQTWRLHSEQLEVAALKTAAAQAVSQQAKDLAKAHAAARSAEAGLQAGADESTRKTNEAVQAALADRDSLLRRLRVAQAAAAARVSQAASAARAAEVVSADPGAELPASLGEADVREAERADAIRLHLAACYVDYERAAAALKAYGDAR